jgi:hypothetical protein
MHAVVVAAAVLHFAIFWLNAEADWNALDRSKGLFVCAQVFPRLQQSGWDVTDALTRMRNGENDLDALLLSLDLCASSLQAFVWDIVS